MYKDWIEIRIIKLFNDTVGFENINISKGDDILMLAGLR